MQIPNLKDCLIDMNDQNARFLELVSTVLYFDNLPKEEVQEKMFTLKVSSDIRLRKLTKPMNILNR